MRFSSYWLDTAPTFSSGQAGPVEGAYDVAVIGGGFTGLSAARRLAMNGAKVVLLEAQTVGSGASGRNGGHLNNGLSHGYASAKSALGPERAKALWNVFNRSVETIRDIVDDEKIDCSFRYAGKLKLASKPEHFAGIAKNFEIVNREVDADTELLTADQLKREIVTGEAHGGLLFKKSAMMHMGRYASGLAEAAARRGAIIFENAPVTKRSVENGVNRLDTPRGSVTAREVFVATGAYTPDHFGWFRRRLVCVGSFIIATRPLSDAEIQASLPGDRTYVSSLNIGNYFRLSPDRRLIWGGRARFSATSDQRSDAKSGAILRESLARVLPALKDVEIDYCWGGLVDMTKDRFPRTGRHDGMWYALGLSGHGAQLSTLLGMTMADSILGKPVDNQLDGLDWPAVPGHFGKPWFLPLVGLYYKTLDRIR